MRQEDKQEIAGGSNCGRQMQQARDDTSKRRQTVAGGRWKTGDGGRGGRELKGRMARRQGRMEGRGGGRWVMEGGSRVGR